MLIFVEIILTLKKENMIFDNMINKQLQDENNEISKKVSTALSKIDRFELEISKNKIEKKFKKYSKVYDKMLVLQMKMSELSDDMNESFQEVNTSVKTILNIGSVKKYITDGDSVLDTNSRLAKQSYTKALRLSEQLLGVEVIDSEDIDFIKDKITFADSMYTVEYVKDTMSSVNEFLTKTKGLDNTISRLGKVDFSKMNEFDLNQINELVTKVLNKRPTSLGNLVKTLKSNPTNNNTIELKLI